MFVDYDPSASKDSHLGHKYFKLISIRLDYIFLLINKTLKSTEPCCDEEYEANTNLALVSGEVTMTQNISNAKQKINFSASVNLKHAHLLAGNHIAGSKSKI
jgi:hypothetical protein